ncbi:MAG: hypothetical protein IKC08_05890 [Lentisphaeria bacterium]|nr:hypothetical protein [Lentisphaeria bacterium]
MDGKGMLFLKKNFSLPLLCICLAAFSLDAKVGGVPVQQKNSLPSAKTVSPAPQAKKTENKTSGKKKLQIQIPAEQQKFFRELAIVLDSIRKNSPRTGKVIDELLKKDSPGLVRHFLQGTKSGIVTITVTEGEKKIIVQPRKKVQKGRRAFYTEELSGGKLKYIFLPDLTSANVKKCADILESFPASSAGIVLDLRNCDDYASSSHTDLFIRHFGNFVQKKGVLQNGDNRVVLAVITGKGTKGNGEIAAYSLRKTPGVITVGAATCGQPFIVRPLPLKIVHASAERTNGGKAKKKIMHILVPVIPDKWKDIPPASIVPRIRTVAEPLYEKGKVPVEKDPALQVASDLLLSMNILHKSK